MSSKTKNLGLFKYDTTTDAKQVFSIDRGMNENWDIIDSNTLAHRHITNCITEIPQRIKYTLEDGTLTIKAGSVVIVPYGTEDLTAQYPIGSMFINDNFEVYDTQYENGKFFVWVELTNDIGLYFENSYTGANFLHLSLGASQGNIFTMRMSNSYSGTTDTLTETDHHGFYNTDENMVYEYNTTGKYTAIFTLPLFVIYGNGVQLYDRIDQVFNGMGYIGSTVWVDKGVKALRCIGKEEDGTLKNLSFVIDRLMITYEEFISANTIQRQMFLSEQGIIARITNNYFIQDTPPQSLNMTGYSGFWYNPRTNRAYTCLATTDVPTWSITGHSVPLCKYFGNTSTNTSDEGLSIYDVKFNDVLNLYKCTDNSLISGLGRPSDKYIDLTLGKTGTTYTAPATGWFQLSKAGVDGKNQYINVSYVHSENDYVYSHNTVKEVNTHIGACLVPITKGKQIKIKYTMTGTTYTFRFIYAEGEV